MRVLSGVLFLQIATITVAFLSTPRTNSVRLHSSELNALTSDDLIRLTKEYLANPSPALLAEDFVFRGPVIGPLAKKVRSVTIYLRSIE